MKARVAVFAAGFAISAVLHAVMILGADDLVVSRYGHALELLDWLGIGHGLDMRGQMAIGLAVVVVALLEFERQRRPAWYAFVYGGASVNIAVGIILGVGIDYIPIGGGWYANVPDLFIVFGVVPSAIDTVMRWYASRRQLEQWRKQWTY